MIFWFTGQPGSGKTTLGKALVEKLGAAFHIDGDDFIYIRYKQTQNAHFLQVTQIN